jgi:hypothetical protein
MVRRLAGGSIQPGAVDFDLVFQYVQLRAMMQIYSTKYMKRIEFAK